eukprot:ANDGO_02701.mRNA.1 hypothetical protein SPRG_13152
MISAASNSSNSGGSSSSIYVCPISGFRNLVPRPREERRALSNKDLLEKQRLANRREGFSRYHASTQPIMVPDAVAAGYLPDADRFHSDTAGEEKRRREAQLQKKQVQMDATRQGRVQKEEDRWKRMDMNEKEEQHRWDSLRGTSKNNISSVSYDVVSMKYHENESGQRLVKEEEMLKYKAAVRAQRLYEKSSSQVDPITGQQVPQRVNLPNKPHM